MLGNVAAQSGYFDEVTMNDRLIGWNQNSAAIVYDRQLQRFVTLPVRHTEFSASYVSQPPVGLDRWSARKPAAARQPDLQG